jgi:hypothetical protein
MRKKRQKTKTTIPVSGIVGAAETLCPHWLFFYHPDFTVGLGISPNRHLSVFADYHCRYGIAPIPEEYIMFEEPPPPKAAGALFKIQLISYD